MGGYKTVVKAPVDKIDNSHSIVYCFFNSSHISGSIIAIVIGLAFVIYLCRVRCGRGFRSIVGKRPQAPPPLVPPLPAPPAQLHPLQPGAALAQYNAAMGALIPYHPQDMGHQGTPSTALSASAPMIMSRPVLPVEALSTGQ